MKKISIICAIMVGLLCAPSLIASTVVELDAPARVTVTHPRTVETLVVPEADACDVIASLVAPQPDIDVVTPLLLQRRALPQLCGCVVVLEFCDPSPRVLVSRPYFERTAVKPGPCEPVVVSCEGPFVKIRVVFPRTVQRALVTTICSCPQVCVPVPVCGPVVPVCDPVVPVRRR